MQGAAVANTHNTAMQTQMMAGRPKAMLGRAAEQHELTAAATSAQADRAFGSQALSRTV
jgi:hypothetical protein